MLVASALSLLRYCSRSLFLPAVEAVAALITQRPKITLRREAAAAQVMEVARPRTMAVRAATARVPGRVQVPGQALVAERVLVQDRAQAQAQEAMAAEEPEQAIRAVAEPLPQA
ncbi:hypothetical protein BFG58_17335 [Enterobacter sp. ku-bf2]|nr:hypothetical protein BFG58_17335 [Enterobacter sp. ku-bf2]